MTLCAIKNRDTITMNYKFRPVARVTIFLEGEKNVVYRGEISQYNNEISGLHQSVLTH